MTALTPSERAAKRREKWQAEHPEDVFGTPAPETTDETEPESEPAPETTDETEPEPAAEAQGDGFEEPLHD